MAPGVDILETAAQSPNPMLKPPVWLDDSYVHECLKVMYATGWYQLPVCFCDITAPSPSLLVSVSKRNGLLKSGKVSTEAVSC